MSTVKERVKGYGIKQALRYMDSDYERNVPKALRWVNAWTGKASTKRHIKPCAT